ncbi:inositol monophosphatase family protein [Pseudomonas panipatensis]|uniref:inositol monophosphatase family protein n=1 Tax=Pseudomonas panipatensis TaxID=428992 RepID=UPI0035B0A34C
MSTRPLTEILQDVISLAKSMGELLVQEWHRDGGPRGAGDKAEIDHEIEVRLRQELLALLDADFWGEETGSRLTGHPYCWVVDPHDGTSDFLQGLPGSSISIGLLHNQVPVLGVVHAPISPDRGSDCIAWAEGLPHLLRNGKPVNVDLSTAGLERSSIVWLSAAAMKKPGINSELCQPARFIAQSSIAYRLARAAIGDGVCGVSLVPLSAHDVAAGHALLRGAGGVLLRQDGKPLTYKSMGLVSSRCFGGAPAACEVLATRLWSRALQAPIEIQQVTLGFPSVELMRRAAGCLAGLIAGDNIGAQVEFMDAASIAERCRARPLRMEDGGVWNILAGQPTDDGELALALARSLVEDTGYSSDGAARAYVHWLNSHPFDIGNTTRQALIGPLRFPYQSIAEACRNAASTRSQANGALMRVAPIGIAAYGQPELAAQWARDDAFLTHPHPICLESNATMAAAIAVGVAGGSRADMLQAALGALSESEESFVVRNCLEAAAAGEPVLEFQEQMGWVLIALQNAFYQLLQEKSLEEAIIDTVLRGGDTDTNASIVGALIGATEGVARVPVDWSLSIAACRPLDTVRSRPDVFWPCDIALLGQALLSVSGSTERTAMPLLNTTTDVL